MSREYWLRMVRCCWRGGLARPISVLPKLRVFVSCLLALRQSLCVAIGNQLANSTALCSNGTLYSGQLSGSEQKVQKTHAAGDSSLVSWLQICPSSACSASAREAEWVCSPSLADEAAADSCAACSNRDVSNSKSKIPLVQQSRCGWLQPLVGKPACVLASIDGQIPCFASSNSSFKVRLCSRSL